MVRAALIRWIQGPPIAGWLALLCALSAVWLPTMIRLAVQGVVVGCEFTPYLPFVLLCAILLRWWMAGVVALGSVVVLGGIFGGSQAIHWKCFVPSAAIFIASSAVMIGIAMLVRAAFAALHQRGADESSGGIVFSLERGNVWASWYGQGPPVLLGSQRKVSEMMKDFLRQEALARRFSDK